MLIREQVIEHGALVVPLYSISFCHAEFSFIRHIVHLDGAIIGSVLGIVAYGEEVVNDFCETWMWQRGIDYWYKIYDKTVINFAHM